MHKMVMQIISKTKVKIDINDIGTLCFGGFSFEKDGISMPFDFSAYSSYPIQNEDNTITVVYESGKGLLSNDFEIDKDTYESLYNENLSIDNIDAKMLSEADSIYELYYDFYLKEDVNEKHLVPINIESISFFDLEDNNKEYKVKQSVIDKFNKQMEE